MPIYNDRDLYLKWLVVEICNELYHTKYKQRGDSVPQISSAVKRKQYDKENMGDRVDMRVVTDIEGSVYDISNGEFANSSLGPSI
jgi:hypothetical protein